MVPGSGAGADAGEHDARPALHPHLRSHLLLRAGCQEAEGAVRIVKLGGERRGEGGGSCQNALSECRIRD